MKIIKLGGSLLTDKNKLDSLRESVLRRVCEEIKKSGEKVLVVHGAGSYGHILAKKYGLNKGFRDEGQLKGLFECYASLNELHLRVVKELNLAGLPAISFRPYAVCSANNGRIKEFSMNPLMGVLKLGLIPVLCGDVVVDESTGFSIVSGDQLVPFLARVLGVEELVFAGGVDGILKNEKVIPIINSFSEVEDVLGGSDGVDVTGGMAGKLKELFDSCPKGCKVRIVNGLVEG
ncbi:MAG: isopentenyl phosphate kinase family protein, partial [Nanoarchaeota archaeon]|nr:isopentenyl phosphate kinase family protein [Nanoarchaeota archaeon]